MDNIIYLNICKHIHAVTKLDNLIFQPSINVNTSNADENDRLIRAISNNTETKNTDNTRK